MPQDLPPNREESPASVPSPASATASDAPPKKPASPKPRKNAVVFIAVIGILAFILVLLNLIPFDQLAEKVTETEAEPPETVNPLFFQTPVYDADFTEDSVYMDYDRKLRFSIQTGETFAISGDASEHGAVCVLFEQFRIAVTEGDTDAYNALFTDEYIEKKGRAEFAPQKLYNLEVAVISSEYLKDGDAKGLYKGATVTYCTVDYCIKDNDGTFRNDFYRDGDSKTQIFEVLEYNGEIKISQISTPKQVNPSELEKEGLPIMFFIWIAAIVLAVVIEALTTELVAIWFVPGAIASMILSLADFGLSVQLIVFFVSALVLVVLFKLLYKKFGKPKQYTPTNADRIIGGTGKVTEEINNLAPTGEVKIDGKFWTARTENEGEIIEVGALVTVLRIEGVKLICCRHSDETH